MPRRRRRRGYPTAVLIGLEGRRASLWNIFSESVQPGSQVEGEDAYSFYESVVDLLRPSVKRGIKSILVAAPGDRDYAEFMGHLEKHQGWLLKGWSLNTVTFERIPEPAMSIDQVRALVKSERFTEKLSSVRGDDVRRVMGALEKLLSDPEGIERILFTIKEVEDAVYGRDPRPEYILVTEKFRSTHARRVGRLLQAASNGGIKTRIVKENTPAGIRITQFGGLVCITRG